MCLEEYLFSNYWIQNFIHGHLLKFVTVLLLFFQYPMSSLFSVCVFLNITESVF